MPQKKMYLGQVPIPRQQFEQLRRQIDAGEKLEAIKLIRQWTGLSLADARHIADNFYTVDFSIPQEQIRAAAPQRSAGKINQEKMRKAAKTVGKAAGVTALTTGYLGLRIIFGLMGRYSKKRR